MYSIEVRGYKAESGILIRSYLFGKIEYALKFMNNYLTEKCNYDFDCMEKSTAKVSEITSPEDEIIFGFDIPKYGFSIFMIKREIYEDGVPEV